MDHDRRRKEMSRPRGKESASKPCSVLGQSIHASMSRSCRGLARGLPLGKDPVGTREVTGVAVRIALQIVLVLRFGFPELADRRHLGDDLARATGPTRSRRRSSPPRPFSARRSYRRSPNGSLCRYRYPDGAASWDRGFGRNTPGCVGSSSPLYRRRFRSPPHEYHGCGRSRSKCRRQYSRRESRQRREACGSSPASPEASPSEYSALMC